MDRAELLKKLTALLDRFQRQRGWGIIDLQIKDGEVVVIRDTNVENISKNPKERGYLHEQRPNT